MPFHPFYSSHKNSQNKTSAHFEKNKRVLTQQDFATLMSPREGNSLFNPVVVKSDLKLPVEKYKSEIKKAISSHKVVIIQGETGSGKSTMIPQYALEIPEIDRVTTTVPRRITAKNLAGYVASQNGMELGKEVCFQNGIEQSFSTDFKINYVTDAFLLSKELPGGHRFGSNEVLFLDEAHEKSKYTEILLGMHKKLLLEDPENCPTLVVMSATLNGQEFKNFFKDTVDDIPILKIPGRTYNITTLRPENSIFESIVKRVSSHNENVLVFLPGKPEIHQMQRQLERYFFQRNKTVNILPLFSELPPDVQKRCFERYKEPKIVLATNIAETGSTIEDIDTVIISGLVKNMIVDEYGTQRLTLMNISDFSRRQQRGRGGRTHDGNVIYHGEPVRSLDPEPPSDLLTTDISSLILAMLNSEEFDCRTSIEKLDTITKLTKEKLDQVFDTLQALNLVGNKGHITKRGEKVARLPVDVRSGTMIVLAEEFAILLNQPNILKVAVNIAAIMQSGPLGVYENRHKWQKLTSGEHDSDLIAQSMILESMIASHGTELSEYGISSLTYRNAIDVRSKLLKALKIKDFNEHCELSILEKRQLLRCIFVSMSDAAYRMTSPYASESKYKRILIKNKKKSRIRVLDRNSCVIGANFVVGQSFDLLTYHDPSKPTLIRILTGVSRIDPNWLLTDTAPNIKKLYRGFGIGNNSKRTKKKKPRYNNKDSNVNW